VHGHVGGVGAGAVVTESVDDRLLVVPDRAQRVAQRPGGGTVGQRVERLAAQRKASRPVSVWPTTSVCTSWVPS
jgi:serine acetyltransferase